MIDFTKINISCERCSKEHNVDSICNCIAERLEYLRGEIEAQRISYGEIAELQDLVDYIDPNDVQLLQWAGVSEAEYSGQRETANA